MPQPAEKLYFIIDKYLEQFDVFSVTKGAVKDQENLFLGNIILKKWTGLAKHLYSNMITVQVCDATAAL